jgi:molecular chaperone DnaK
MAELNAAWTAASEDIYKSQAEAGGQPGAGAAPNDDQPQQPTGGNTDNVTDVPYEEVK